MQGALKAINNNDKTKDPGGDGVSFKTDAFGMVLDYYPNDYVNSRSSGIQTIKGVNTSSIVTTESYAGNIKAMSWFSKKPSVVTDPTDAPTAYIFNYDDKYQFTESTWGTTLNFANTPASFTTTTFNKEKIKDPSTGVPGYDANGNIKYLQRYGTTGSIMDKFTYNYVSNTNKLSSVIHDNAGTNQTYASYTYDAIGQLTYENTLNTSNKKYIKYDVTGKVILVARDAAFTQKVVEYVYNDLGQRVIRRSYNPSTYALSQTTFYVAGSVYTQTGGGGAITLQEQDIDGGMGRIGTFYRPTSVYAYEMTDHLGNVRAVVAKNAGNLEVRMYNDYYPYGMVIQSGGTNYRYQYQGQYAEKDAETDWNAFELRMYDSRIARWLSVDPEGQHWSPYLSMGNDPTIHTDPNGGNDDPDPGYRYKDGKAYQQAETKDGAVWAEYLNSVTVTPGGKGSMQWYGFSMAYGKNYWQNKDKFYSRLYNKEKTPLVQKGDSKSYQDQVQLFQNRHNAELDGRKFEAGFVATVFSPLIIYAGATAFVAAAPTVSSMYSSASMLAFEKSIEYWGIANLAANSVKSRILLAAFGVSNKVLPYSWKKQIINEAKGFTNFATEENFKQLIDQVVPGLPPNW